MKDALQECCLWGELQLMNLSHRKELGLGGRCIGCVSTSKELTCSDRKPKATESPVIRSKRRLFDDSVVGVVGFETSMAFGVDSFSKTGTTGVGRLLYEPL